MHFVYFFIKLIYNYFGVYMKKILISIIKLYQSMPLSCHGMCKHIPSCSNYAIEAIENYGCFKGSYLAFKRILKCSPFGTIGYDPVPKRSENFEKDC